MVLEPPTAFYGYRGVPEWQSIMLIYDTWKHRHRLLTYKVVHAGPALLRQPNLVEG